VSLIRTVRKIQPEDIDTRGDQTANRGFAVGRRPQRGDDLRSSHAVRGPVRVMDASLQ
jgi:2-keto-4-pentenoate hydratase